MGQGQDLDQALAIKNTQIAEELALPPVKIHCSILAEDAIKAAVLDYQNKHAAPKSFRRRPSPACAGAENQMAITLTEKAAKHINRYIERRGKGIGLRFGVRTTGCSGMAYKLEYVDEVAPKTACSNRTASKCSSIRKACRTSTARNWTSRAKA
jgi:hypothetical protein